MFEKVIIKLLFRLCFCIVIFSVECYQYEIPKPITEILLPEGFRVSIPDEPGIKLFAFNGAINKQLKGIEPGDFAEDIFTATNGKWSYENHEVSIKPGDTLYYWIHVQHNNLVYRLLDRSISIPNKLNDVNDNIVNTTKAYPALNDSISKHEVSDVERLKLVDERLKSIRANEFDLNNNIETCTLSKTIVNGRPVCSRTLIFEDNFNYFNWLKWQRVIEIPSEYEDAEFVSFQHYPQNCYITDGLLRIVPSLLQDAPGFNQNSIRNGTLNLGSRCTSYIDFDITCKRETQFFRILPPIVSAKLRTKPFFSFKYGQVDIRAKLPVGDWSFPQLFLQPLNETHGMNKYASGQLRIAFIRGNFFLRTANGEDINGQKLYGGAVLTTEENFRDKWLKNMIQEEHFGSKFHIYSIIWDDESITLALDGKSYATLKNDFKAFYKIFNKTHSEEWSIHSMTPFDKEFYLEIGVSAGGRSDFPDNSLSGLGRTPKPWKNANPKSELNFWNAVNSWYPSWTEEKAGMIVDYIRVYAI